MSGNIAVYAIVFLAAMAFFGWSSYRQFRLITIGKPDNRFNEIGRRIWNMLLYAFGQRRVVSRPFGINHFVLFWCFMILLLANAEFLFNGVFPDFISLSKLPAVANFTLSFIFDIVSILALLTVCIAIIRRLIFPPSYIEARSPDAFVILSLVGILMIAFFGLHASEIRLGQEEAAAYMPMSSFAATAFMSEIQPMALGWLKEIFWWIHALVLLAFLNYLPYSKHMHIMTAIPNCFFRSLEKVNIHPHESLETSDVFGVEQVNHFTWKHLFDSYSCTECGRCSDVCPATSTGKMLNPRLMIHDIKINLLHNGPLLSKNDKQDIALPLVGGGHEGSISEEMIWDCTTCGACQEVCPVFIEHVPKIIELRRNLTMAQSRMPEGVQLMLRNMQTRGHPWVGVQTLRLRGDWTSDLELTKLSEESEIDILLWVGCAAALCDRNVEATIALVKVLRAAGVNFGVLGEDEACCGDPARRAGYEFQFQVMAEQNIEVFKSFKVKQIVTICPHCYNTFKNEYPKYGAEIKVVHYTELIADLLKQGKLKLQKELDISVTYHDPCYLGRYNNVYSAPRYILESISPDSMKEMQRSKSNSFCCGGGGAHMWFEQQTGTKINVMRAEDALKSGAETVITTCPYCLQMFEEGLQLKDAGTALVAKDMSELIAESLEQT